jgi:hypothetical protein
MTRTFRFCVAGQNSVSSGKGSLRGRWWETADRATPLWCIVQMNGSAFADVSCDVVARIALPGVIKSLNVSNATALALYVVSKRIKAI